MRRVVSVLLAGMLGIVVSCHRGLPKPGTTKYTQFVQAFYVGLAAMEVGNDVRAESSFAEATQLAPGEPAAWTDWGILALRQRNYDQAKERLDRAHSLVPHNGQIDADLGTLESTRGNSAAAIEDFREAIRRDPRNVRALEQLAQEVERQGGAGAEAEVQRLIQQILSVRPHNLPALLELSRIAAKRGDAVTLRSAVKRVAAQSVDWPPVARQQLAALQSAVDTAPATAALRSVFLRNVLMQDAGFRQSLAVIRAQPGEEAQPFRDFLRLASPSSRPAPADTALRFISEPLPNPLKQKWDWIGGVLLHDSPVASVITANATTVSVMGGPSFPFPGGQSSTAPGPESIVPVDFNYDFKTDLVLAGAGGVRFLRQDSSEKFTDVTTETKLPRPVLDGNYGGAWAVDIEADGDLDVVLGTSSGTPTVLRNNGDGTFTPTQPLAGISGMRQFVWADLNNDGIPDAALLDGAGHLHIFLNERSGHFREAVVPRDIRTVTAMAAADTRHVGRVDLLVVRNDGAILRLMESDGVWLTAEIGHVPDPAMLNASVRLVAADLDNNGAVDLILTQAGNGTGNGTGKGTGNGTGDSTLIWLGNQDGRYTLLEHPFGSGHAFAAAAADDNGHLDLLALDGNGNPAKAVNHGTKNYHWQVIRTRAVTATGDQRINSFGVGGAVQIRSGLLLQAQVITGPAEHFGLGEWGETDVARILWPNGVVNAEFALQDNQEVLAQQRLKGSCPFLFAWDGREMRFVKDTVPWGSAIGLRINNLGPARIAATQEWYKIPRQDLVARDGVYDLSITGELWETYYYDWLQLMTVDHPRGTEIFTDERFVVPPVKLAITATDAPHPIAGAVDDRGTDVTQILRSLDGHYLDTFGRGQYQGVTRDHYVEIDLGEDVPAKGPLYLIARGWLHPSDSSINVAMSQGHHPEPMPLRLKVPDGHGGWMVARPNLGFPAGRNKICLIDLTGVFRAGTPRKVRLQTDLEIYWDQIQWAQGLPETPLRISRIEPSTADLHYRGYSTIHQVNASAPEVPDYNHLAATTQIWPDLEGYYTRYGDVRALLKAIDDRYVIMNAGDEMALHFAAPASPPAGWVRDYVLAGDGWIKDGDYNSTGSATVRPLPYHARTVYDTPPAPLEDEWVYRHHPEDWRTWQTRYVTPDLFRNALNDQPGKLNEGAASR